MMVSAGAFITAFSSGYYNRTKTTKKNTVVLDMSSHIAYEHRHSENATQAGMKNEISLQVLISASKICYFNFGYFDSEDH